MNEAKENVNSSDDNEIHELTSDIEVLGPGKILSDARKKMGLSQQDIATRLNFHLSLVKSIEDEKFDKHLPDTFLKGYLRSFAKMVNVSEQDILASYEVLGVAEKQCAEMQSFSQSTKKQAEHSRLMWVSYLMLTILIGSTVYWFFQESLLIEEPQQVDTTSEQTANLLTKNTINKSLTETKSLNKNDIESVESTIVKLKNIEQPSIGFVNDNAAVLDDNIEQLNTITRQTIEENNNDIQESIGQPEQQAIPELNATADVNQPKAVQFVFSGDCWVNIYDATGERVAWGVKKEGYIMNFEGFAPFNVTLGRPEVVSITYQNESVALSQFTAGKTVKFTLPIATN